MKCNEEKLYKIKLQQYHRPFSCHTYPHDPVVDLLCDLVASPESDCRVRLPVEWPAQGHRPEGQLLAGRWVQERNGQAANVHHMMRGEKWTVFETLAKLRLLQKSVINEPNNMLCRKFEAWFGYTCKRGSIKKQFPGLLFIVRKSTRFFHLRFLGLKACCYLSL